MFLSAASSKLLPHYADALVEATPYNVSIHFDFPIHDSKPVDFAQSGGVYEEVDNELKAFAVMLAQAMNEMGLNLRARQVSVMY